MTHRYLVPALLATTTIATSQVPPSVSVVFHAGSGVSSIVLHDVRNGGSVTPITGLPSVYANRSTGAVDPVTGNILLGGSNNNSVLSLHTIRGVGITGSRNLATVLCQSAQYGCSGGLPIALNGIDFDRSGNYFVINNVEIWRVDRHTGALTLWDVKPPRPNGGVFGDLFRGIHIDRDRNQMWVISFNGTTAGTGLGQAALWQYDLSQGPSAGTKLFDGTGQYPRLTPYMTDVVHDGNGALYLSGTGWFGTPDLMRHDLATGTTNALAGVPGWQGGIDALAFDRATGLLHVAGWLDGYATIDPATGQSRVHFPPAGVAPNEIDVHDRIDRTQLFPREPSVSAPFTLEIAAYGNPGDLAAIGIIAANGTPFAAPVPLTVGICDAGGILGIELQIQPAGLPVGLALRFQGIRLDAATNQVVLGSTVDVVMQR